MRRLKRRISQRQFMDWQIMHTVRPIDGDRRRDNLLAQCVVFLARAAGVDVQFDQLINDPFDPDPKDDFNAIMQAFQASG